MVNEFVDAYQNARFLCEEYYKTAPECTFHVKSRKSFIHIAVILSCS